MKKKLCSVSGCETFSESKGMCSRHYEQTRNGRPITLIGSPRSKPKNPKVYPIRLCSVVDCGRKHSGRGYCDFHYRRWLHGKEIEAPITRENRPRLCQDVRCRELPLEDSSFCETHKRKNLVLHSLPRKIQADGYITVLDKKREHRWIMENILNRKLKEKEEIHHKNAIKYDNSPENLEIWIGSQPPGSRLSDLLEFVVLNYRKELLELL